MSGRRTPELAEAAVQGGADLIELGFPFSDPLADGPVIRRAAEAALAEGMRTKACLECLAEIRERVQIPLVPFVYSALLEAYGYERFVADARSRGSRRDPRSRPSGRLPPRARADPAGRSDLHRRADSTGGRDDRRLALSGHANGHDRRAHEAFLSPCRLGRANPSPCPARASALRRLRYLDARAGSRCRRDHRRGHRRLACDRDGRRRRGRSSSLRRVAASGDR